MGENRHFFEESDVIPVIEHNPETDETVGKALNFIREHLDEPRVQCNINGVGKDDDFLVVLLLHKLKDNWEYKMTVSPIDFNMGIHVTLKEGSKEKVSQFLRSDRALEKTLDKLYLTLKQAEKTFAPGSDFYDPYLHF